MDASISISRFPWVRVSRRRLALAGITAFVILGATLRAGAIGGDKRISSDELGYGGNANRILEGRPPTSLRWSPGTSVLFAIATRLDGHRGLDDVPRSRGPAQYAQLLVEIATLLLIAAVAWRLAGPGAAVLAVAVAALYEPLVLITRTYLSEPLGGLMILGTFAAAAWARGRSSLAVAAAGVLGGVGCLSREDLFPGVLVIAVALACSAWSSSRRSAILRGVLYLACVLAVIAPWVLYASNRDGRFVPISDGGPNALFIGTYLPGGGEQQGVLEAFKARVCRRYPWACRMRATPPPGPMFDLIASRYPRLSRNAAITRADLENLRLYALGRPLAFLGMLGQKLWRMWSYPWSGGDSYNGRLETSRLQHLIFAGLAWLGLLAGAVVTRRWSFVTAAIGLGAIAGLNILVNAQGRDNVRLMPLLFAFGAPGSWVVAARACTYIRSQMRPAEPTLG